METITKNLTDRGTRILACLNLIYLMSNTKGTVRMVHINNAIKQHNLPELLLPVLRTEKIIKRVGDVDVLIDKQRYEWVYEGKPTHLCANNIDTLMNNLGKEDEQKPKIKQMDKKVSLKRGRWSHEELEYLRLHMDFASETDIAKTLNRSVKGVNAKKWKIRHDYDEANQTFENKNTGVKGEVRPREPLSTNVESVKNPLDNAEIKEATDPIVEPKKRTRKRISNEEIEFIKNTMADDPNWVAEQIGRTPNAICNARSNIRNGKLKVSKKRTSRKPRVKKRSLLNRLFGWIPRIKFEKR